MRLDLAYDGAPFRGFAENSGVTTVAGSLRAAAERVLRQELVLSCAGRTDAGVHARDQVVTFDVSGVEPDTTALRNSLNSMLGPSIAVRSVRLVDADHDARYSARWRLYRYQVLNAGVPDPFLARTAWWIADPLDLDRLARASQALLGPHDFSSFCRRPKSAPEMSLVREVLHATWVDDTAAGVLRFEIAGTAFCHQMVRSIVGTLVDIGRGRRAVASMPGIIAARHRDAASNVAPPHGLCLHQVGYEPWPSGADITVAAGA